MDSLTNQERRILKKLGASVRAARLVQNLSQEALADLSGLDRTYIGGVERGERNISAINIARLCKALHVTPNQLFGESE